MSQPFSHVASTLQTLVWTDAYSAVKYLSPKKVVKVTRQHRSDLRLRSGTFLVTMGKPNYAERKFVKAAIKAGEPFPIKKVQVKHFTKK